MASLPRLVICRSFLRSLPPLSLRFPSLLMCANPGVKFHAIPLLSVVIWSLASSIADAAENIQVFFSPHGGCTEAVVDNLGRATNSVLVQAYSFTSAPIAKALTDAKKRGVNVQVILDKSNLTGQYSSADFVAHANIPTYIDSKHAISHNKIMVIDGKTILTGSFNFTKAAEGSNAENLLVIQDPALAKLYTANWKAHLEHSQAYESGSAQAAKATRSGGSR